MTTQSYTDEQVPEVVRTAPERIFLQVGDDSYYDDMPFPASADGVSWWKESVLDCEVEYVRADLFAASEAERQRLQADVETLRPDAERYRWLREDHRAVERDGSVYVRWVQMTGGVITGSDILTERDLDMVIDCDRATPNETKEAKS